MKAKTCRINGVAMRVRTDGDRRDPSVVLANSLGTDHTMWDVQAEELARHFHVIRYDTRGHGASGSPPGPYCIDMLGNDVLGLLNHLDIQRAHFVGLSMGGVIGQWLGVHAPDRIDHLVLANTAARIGTREGWQARAAAVRASGLDEIAAGSPGRWFTPGFVDSHATAVQAMLHVLRLQTPEGYAGCCDALAMADLRNDIVSIRAPVLVIAGNQDPVTTVGDAQALCAAIPHSALAVVAASHLSNIEAPRAFTRELLSFLRT
ncbi:3-oxoadipate enol-lactonase [Massilia sp. METH4]|uniref:3-oxoadipate enol-lactonase n=1 Tax=Massilia sp. METH4 TaxID=3123041 RepID=UPI0030CD5B3D